MKRRTIIAYVLSKATVMMALVSQMAFSQGEKTTPNAFAKRNDVSITISTEQERFHNCYIHKVIDGIVYIVRCYGTVMIPEKDIVNFKVYALRKGDILLVNGDLVHGKVIDQDAETTKVQMRNGSTMQIASERILDVASKTRPLRSMPAVSREFRLTQLKRVHHLDLQKIGDSDLEHLVELKNLKQLVLGNSEFSSLEQLSTLKMLEGLTLDKTVVKDWLSIRKIPVLSLKLRGIHGFPLEIFANKHLQSIRLERCGKIDIEALAHILFENMLKLKELEVESQEISNGKALSSFTNLSKLGLVDCKVRSIPELVGLRSLDLSKNPGLKTLSGVSKMKKLEELDIGETGITDLKELQSLKHLHSLNLQMTSIVDLSPVAGFKSLQRIFLHGLKLKSLAPLGKLENLEYIYVDASMEDKIRDAVKHSKGPKLRIITPRPSAVLNPEGIAPKVKTDKGQAE